ncbi:MAG TPA: hypothetical protein VGP47_05750 [Parachlamydiaceae bacterium]|nr:hypothetical protein [Parachlamydiaceae bacterium]
MKILRTVFSSLLLLTAVCQFAPAVSHAEATVVSLPNYQNMITDVQFEYEGSMLGGVIKINDNLVLRIKDYKNRDDNVMKTWHPGDFVSLESQKTDDTLILTVKRINGAHGESVVAYTVFDVLDSTYKGLQIIEIKDNGEYVRLNDNTVWQFGFYNRFSTKKWSVGERVVIQGTGEKNSYGFINLDAPITKNVSAAEASFVVY